MSIREQIAPSKEGGRRLNTSSRLRDLKKPEAHQLMGVFALGSDIICIYFVVV